MLHSNLKLIYYESKCESKRLMTAHDYFPADDIMNASLA